MAAIKPQAAFFEQQGPDGMRLLQTLGRAAIDAGMLVIMDAKRGDIGSTSTAYANAWIGHDATFPSDALTVNPWLGIDTLGPFLTRADATFSGLFVLNRTSNDGAGDLQDQLVNGAPLYMHLASMLAPLAAVDMPSDPAAIAAAVINLVSVFIVSPDSLNKFRERLFACFERQLSYSNRRFDASPMKQQTGQLLTNNVQTHQ